MRRILIASLLLVPMTLTAAAATSKSSNDASATTPVIFPVVPAKIVYAPKADLTSALTEGFPHDEKVVVSFVVDTNGEARNVKVIGSDDPALNGPVVAAISKYHFRAATQGNQVVTYPMNLAVTVQR